MPSVNDDVTDAVCEMTNTVSGRAAPRLATKPVRVGVPEVVLGRSRPIDFFPGTLPLVIEFCVEDEPVVLELGLREAGGEETLPNQ